MMSGNHRLQRSDGGGRFGDGFIVRRRPLNLVVLQTKHLAGSTTFTYSF